MPRSLSSGPAGACGRAWIGSARVCAALAGVRSGLKQAGEGIGTRSHPPRALVGGRRRCIVGFTVCKRHRTESARTMARDPQCAAALTRGRRGTDVAVDLVPKERPAARGGRERVGAARVPGGRDSVTRTGARGKGRPSPGRPRFAGPQQRRRGVHEVGPGRTAPSSWPAPMGPGRRGSCGEPPRGTMITGNTWGDE